MGLAVVSGYVDGGNGSYRRNVSLTVHVTPGFLFQAWMSLRACAYGDASASFGNTARIESTERPEGFSFDTSGGAARPRQPAR